MLERRTSLDDEALYFAVIGPQGAIHFHVNPSDPSDCGVERHSHVRRTACDAERGDCWLLNGPCFHDGSTLAAREGLLPKWKRGQDTGDMEPLWKELEDWYDAKLSEPAA